MPRHPPCTLHRLTTFTDHRPRRAGMVGPYRTATRVTPRDAHDTRSVPRSHRKGARLVTPASTRDRPKRRRSARTLASAGGESATHKKTLRDKTIHLSKSSTRSLSLHGPHESSCDERGQVSRCLATADWSEFDHFQLQLFSEPRHRLMPVTSKGVAVSSA